jgi:hypothetical protein
VAKNLVDVAVTDSAPALIQLASDHCIQIGDLWGYICKMMDVDPMNANWEPDAAHDDVPELWGKSSQGFSTPRYHGNDLRDTIAWYEANPDFASERAYQ